jgi:hypothetical protein
MVRSRTDHHRDTESRRQKRKGLPQITQIQGFQGLKKGRANEEAIGS